MKNTKLILVGKIIFLFIFFFNFFVFLSPSQVSADRLIDRQVGLDIKGEAGEAFGETVNSVDQVSDVRIVISKIIRIFLGFMGIVFLILVIYGGFLWMTASGRDDQVNKAKSLLISGIIGLVVVVSAYSIAALVTDKVYMSTQPAAAPPTP